MNKFNQQSIQIEQKPPEILKWHPTQKMLIAVSSLSELIYECSIYQFDQSLKFKYSVLFDLTLSKHSPSAQLIEIDVHQFEELVAMRFSDGIISVWNYSSGRLIIDRQFIDIAAVKFLSSGNRIGLVEKDNSQNSKYTIWNYGNSTLQSYFIEFDEHFLETIIFHPSYKLFVGKYANTSDENGLWLYDAMPAQDSIWRYNESMVSEMRADFYAICFSPDGQYVTYIVEMYESDEQGLIKATIIGVYDLTTNKIVSKKRVAVNIPKVSSLFFVHNDLIICVIDVDNILISWGDVFNEWTKIEQKLPKDSHLSINDFHISLTDCTHFYPLITLMSLIFNKICRLTLK